MKCSFLSKGGPSLIFTGAIFASGAVMGAEPLEKPATGPDTSPQDETHTLKRLSLEELMSVKVETQSTLSRVAERIDDAPGSVHVYSREMIQHRGYRSLGELLQTVPGFTVFHRDLEFVTSVRGLAANDNDKVTLLINGQQFNGAHEHSFLNGPINLDNVERVEVVVGPSSLFQQADTLAATVNVITKVVDGVDMIGAVGNDLKYSTTLMAGHHWAEDKFLNFSFTTEEKEGFDAWSGDFRRNLAGRSLSGRLDEPNFFSVLNGQYGEVTAQLIAYKTFWPELIISNGSLDNQGEMTEERYSMFVKDEHPWSDTLTSVVRLDATLKEQTRFNEGGPPTNALELSVKQWDYRAEFGVRYTGFDHQVIQAGMQLSHTDNFDTYYTFNNTESGADIHIPKTTLVSDNSDGVGFYIDDTASINNWLKVVGGLRVDYDTKLDDGKWFPGGRAAIIVTPTENWTSKLIYNRSVRMPSDLEAMNEQWGSNHLDTAPSFATASLPAQRPEILETVEWQNIYYIGDVRLGATLYHQELQDFISWFQPHSNGGNFRGNGVELSIYAPLDRDFALWGNAAWNDSTLNLFQPVLAPDGTVESHHAYTNPEGRIIGSAEYTANLGFDWRIAEHVTFSPSVRFFTNQAALDHTSDEYKTIRNRFYLDAGLTWDHLFDKEVDVRLAGRNLLNNRDAVASQMNGDTYRPRGTELVLTLETRF
jgi:iron complex outermembrane receptor protein